MQELRELKLYGNEITEIEGLDKLCELCALLLQHNKIASIGTCHLGSMFNSNS